jgi:hypothetical protein
MTKQNPCNYLIQGIWRLKCTGFLKHDKTVKLFFFKETCLRAVYTRVFGSVSRSTMAPLPNCFLCIIRYVIAREKQRKQLGSGAIADGETKAKRARVDGPLTLSDKLRHKLFRQIKYKIHLSICILMYISQF